MMKNIYKNILVEILYKSIKKGKKQKYVISKFLIEKVKKTQKIKNESRRTVFESRRFHFIK